MKAIHPGEHLAEELREMGLSTAELSRQLGRSNQGTANDQRSSILRHPTRCLLTFQGNFSDHARHGTQ